MLQMIMLNSKDMNLVSKKSLTGCLMVPTSVYASTLDQVALQ